MSLAEYSIDDILLRRRSLRRQLLLSPDLLTIRIAILGGSTTNELVDLLEIFLLNTGFRPVFHQTEYGRYYTDAVLAPEEIVVFNPDLIYLHTSVRNIERFAPVESTEAEMANHVSAEFHRFQEIWTSLEERVGCQIIQNNFELPLVGMLGNLDAVHPGGRSRFVNELNLQFAREAAKRPKLLLQDVHGLSARVGLSSWFDQDRWFSYKISTTVEGSLTIARSLASMVQAMYGRSRKCLILDLDNTLWGGVIGDDGVSKLQIGTETPVAEAYTAFQEYCLAQRDRGVLLAVCSKNDEETAKQGFEHPDSVLKLEHFSAFRANWDPKHESVMHIARELNLGVDSLVFVDDNPAERSLVAAQVPGVAVPQIGEEVSKFVEIIEAERYFEPVALGKEDLDRSRLYRDNSRRAAVENKFACYADYLDSLAMEAEIDSFNPVYIDRIAQLTNKTNQFNLTTRRYTLSEIAAVIDDAHHLGLYGRLLDRFGDNGLVSVVLGRREGSQLHLDLWLMSCRVLKRDMEVAMLDVLVERARGIGVDRIFGYYRPTRKNGMVAAHYEGLGFVSVSRDHETGETVWALNLTDYLPKNIHIALKAVLRD